MQLDRAAANEFVGNDPLNKAGIYQRVEIHRWSNSYQKRASDYRRKGMQQFLCTGPKTGTPEFFRAHLHAHESYFASYGDSFIFRGPIRSADGAENIGTALLLELPDRAAADKFWNEEPFAKNGGYPGVSHPIVPGHEIAGVIDSLGEGAQARADLLQQCLASHLLDVEFDLAGLDLRHVEQVVDDRQKMLAVGLNGLELPALLGIERTPP